jgi:hypothetical protein
MGLSLNLVINYVDEKMGCVESPVFDSFTFPLPRQRVVGNVDISLMTFFLVYETREKKMLRWVDCNLCNIVSVREKGGGVNDADK